MWVCASQLKLEIQVLDCCIQFWNTWIHLKFGKPNTISFNIIVTCHLSLLKWYKNCYRAAANPTLVRHLKNPHCMCCSYSLCPHYGWRTYTVFVGQITQQDRDTRDIQNYLHQETRTWHPLLAVSKPSWFI